MEKRPPLTKWAHNHDLTAANKRVALTSHGNHGHFFGCVRIWITSTKKAKAMEK